MSRASYGEPPRWVVRIARFARLAGIALVLMAVSALGADQASDAGRTDARDRTFAEARGHADEQRFDEAIRLARTVHREAPGVFDYQLFLARVLGWADRNGSSADEFSRLATAHPARRSSFLHEWVQQLLWSERFEQTVARCDEGLERTPDDRRLLELRAQAIAWSGDAPGAVRAYRDLLSVDPGSGAYRFRYAQNLSWTGREAAARRFLVRIPEPARTAEEIGLLRHLERSATRPFARTLFATSSDSDDLDIRTFAVEGGFGPDPSLWVGASYRRDAFDGGDRTIDVDRIGGIVRWRSGDVSAGAHVRVGSATPIETTPVTGVAGVSWRVADRVALSLDLERVDYESFRGLEREVIGQFTSLSLSLYPHARVDARAGVGVGVIDGPGEVISNRRVHASGEVGFLALRRPRARVFASAYAFSFSELLAEGYWNPESYRTVAIGADVNPTFPRIRSEMVLVGSIGLQRETPGETETSAAFTARWLTRLGPASLEYRFDTTDSAMSTEGGFSRTRHSFILSGIW